MTHTATVLEVVSVGTGVVHFVEHKYDYPDTPSYNYSYRTYTLPEEGRGLEALNNARKVLEFLASGEAQETYGTVEPISAEQLTDTIEEEVAEIAEDLEISFVYQKAGRTREYTPAAAWEASGGCEWEESAQYGYDYGWDC